MGLPIRMPCRRVRIDVRLRATFRPPPYHLIPHPPPSADAGMAPRVAPEGRPAFGEQSPRIPCSRRDARTPVTRKARSGALRKSKIVPGNDRAAGAGYRAQAPHCRFPTIFPPIMCYRAFATRGDRPAARGGLRDLTLRPDRHHAGPGVFSRVDHPPAGVAGRERSRRSSVTVIVKIGSAFAGTSAIASTNAARVSGSS